MHCTLTTPTRCPMETRLPSWPLTQHIEFYIYEYISRTRALPPRVRAGAYSYEAVGAGMYILWI